MLWKQAAVGYKRNLHSAMSCFCDADAADDAAR
jgi:hypothetical protein